MSIDSARFQAEGYLCVPGVFSSIEVAVLAAEAERLAGLSTLIHSNNLRCRWADHVETGECRFDCFDPVIDLSPQITAATQHPALLHVLAAIYGEPARLFKDKLIYKPPGAPGYDLHQDWLAWEGFPQSFVTVIVAIDAATAEAGATEVYPGLHKAGCLSPADGEFHRLKPEQVEGVEAVPLLLAPGDVAVFSGHLPHRSGANRSSHSRRLLYLSYNAASDGGDLRESHYQQFQAWLRGKYAQFGRSGVYFD